jgi:RNA polymerase sigma factor (sigma-70 family)
MTKDGRPEVTVSEAIAERFQLERPRLRALCYRMLGSLSDADDAVQETWLRLARSDVTTIASLQAWLTTVSARVCLDMLRARTARREQPLGVHVPDPIVTPDERTDPEEQAVLAESVSLALLVVLDTLSPSERLAFVLHDVFGVPFDRIGVVLQRSSAAAKQLASRARARLRTADPARAADPARHRDLVDAFLAASTEGRFDDLLALLDPDIVLRADAGDGPLGPSKQVHGPEAVARQASLYASLARYARRVLVNGAPGFLVAVDGQPRAIIGVTVAGDRITEIDILADPVRLAGLDLTDVLAS